MFKQIIKNNKGTAVLGSLFLQALYALGMAQCCLSEIFLPNRIGVFYPFFVNQIFDFPLEKIKESAVQI